MTEPTELSQLRHLYQNMVNGAVRDTASAKRIAEGLLAPAIAALERTTPQPTQTQAGAVPLTCEWAHNEDDGFWDTECGQSWRFDDGGPKENHMNFCHCCGKPLRIKGGQHGVE